MSQSRAVYISVELHPPQDTPVGNLLASTTHNFPVSSVRPSDLNNYYAALRNSLENAKNVVGTELTEWRDAVGKLELSKEPKLAKGADPDDDDEEGEDAGEA